MRLLQLRFTNINSLAGTWEIDFTNADFRRSPLFAIIGPTGSGKSTLLKCIYRILKPSGGRILLGERELSTLSHRESARETAVLAQHHSAAFDFSVRDGARQLCPPLGRGAAARYVGACAHAGDAVSHPR